MKINKVTITGADDNVNQLRLKELSEKFPFVEWGILFTSSKLAKQRYPSIDWIAALLDHNVPLSAHFCGWWSKQVLEESNMILIHNLTEQFKRVQLNYNFNTNKGILINFEPIVKIAKENPDRSIIFQYNKSNKPILDFLAVNNTPDNINFLYDSSGGRGTEIESIGYPIHTGSKTFYTGYSGGLNLTNIVNVCDLIEQCPNENECWIDLESGARTNNEFDLYLVEAILNIVSKYIKIK